jgi:hypothetical protein
MFDSGTYPPEYFTLATITLRTVTILEHYGFNLPGARAHRERRGRERKEEIENLRPTFPYKCGIL